MSAHELLSLSTFLGSIVRIGSDAENDELNWDTGMLALVIEVSIECEEVNIFKLDFRPFMEHNTSLMGKNFFDKNGVPRLTAIEAEQWKNIDEWCLPPFEDFGNRMEIVSKVSKRMFKRGYRNLEKSLSMFSSYDQYYYWTRRNFPKTMGNRFRNIAGVSSSKRQLQAA